MNELMNELIKTGLMVFVGGIMASIGFAGWDRTLDKLMVPFWFLFDFIVSVLEVIFNPVKNIKLIYIKIRQKIRDLKNRKSNLKK